MQQSSTSKSEDIDLADYKHILKRPNYSCGHSTEKNGHSRTLAVTIWRIQRGDIIFVGQLS